MLCVMSQDKYIQVQKYKLYNKTKPEVQTFCHTEYGIKTPSL